MVLVSFPLMANTEAQAFIDRAKFHFNIPEGTSLEAALGAVRIFLQEVGQDTTNAFDDALPLMVSGFITSGLRKSFGQDVIDQIREKDRILAETLGKIEESAKDILDGSTGSSYLNDYGKKVLTPPRIPVVVGGVQTINLLPERWNIQQVLARQGLEEGLFFDVNHLEYMGQDITHLQDIRRDVGRAGLHIQVVPERFGMESFLMASSAVGQAKRSGIPSWVFVNGTDWTKKSDWAKLFLENNPHAKVCTYESAPTLESALRSELKYTQIRSMGEGSYVPVFIDTIPPLTQTSRSLVRLCALNGIYDSTHDTKGTHNSIVLLERTETDLSNEIFKVSPLYIAVVDGKPPIHPYLRVMYDIFSNNSEQSSFAILCYMGRDNNVAQIKNMFPKAIFVPIQKGYLLEGAMEACEAAFRGKPTSEEKKMMWGGAGKAIIDGYLAATGKP